MHTIDSRNTASSNVGLNGLRNDQEVDGSVAGPSTFAADLSVTQMLESLLSQPRTQIENIDEQRFSTTKLVGLSLASRNAKSGYRRSSTMKIT